MSLAPDSAALAGFAGSVPGTARGLDSFERDVTELGRALRDDVGWADFRHLRRIAWVGRACSLLGLATAWIAPNPLSILLIAQGMTARFFIGHHIGHGAYEGIAGLPSRYARRRFGRGWRRLVDWLDWWSYDDWLYTHNQLHHPNTQAPLDGDIMDSSFLVRLPKWLRLCALGLLTCMWKVLYYAPRMRRERARRDAGIARNERYEMQAADLLNVSDPVVRTLWLRDYLPFVLVRFALPTLIVSPLGAWAALSMLANSILGELVHSAQTFVCIRPSHCAADIPLFTARFKDRKEFYLQSLLGTVNYRARGEVTNFLHGWTNYQIEHHLWPALTLLQYRKARPRLIEICQRHDVPYREEPVLARYARTARLFMGMEHQSSIDTAALARRPERIREVLACLARGSSPAPHAPLR